MTIESRWLAGALWGTAAAAVSSLFILTGELLRAHGEPSPAESRAGWLLLAWWTTTPACCAAAAAAAGKARRGTAALAWAVACALPWVLAIHAAVHGRFPEGWAGAAGILARAGVAGAAFAPLFRAGVRTRANRTEEFGHAS